MNVNMVSSLLISKIFLNIYYIHPIFFVITSTRSHVRKTQGENRSLQGHAKVRHV